MSDLEPGSRYSYGTAYRFAWWGGHSPGVLVGRGHAFGDGECPWPLEYARQVFDGVADPDANQSLVALVGSVDDPDCAITIGKATGAFLVEFRDGPLPTFAYYSMAVAYGSQFEAMSVEDREKRFDQIFLAIAKFGAVVDGLEGSVVALFRPNGKLRVVLYAGSEKPEILDWHDCPGLDPEDLWLPTPAFDDYRAIETREPRVLAAVRAHLSERIS